MAGPIRVLLVDDDPSLADLMANQLRRLREEFSICVETDPNDALEAIEETDFDCVVSDYHMPGIDGLEFLRYVREMEPTVPFILFTARGSEEIASEAVSEDVTDYFRKRRGSEQWQVLANRIENAAAKYRAERAVHRRESALRKLARTAVEGSSTPTGEVLELGRETLAIEYAAVLCEVGDDVEVLVEDGDELPFSTVEGIPLADEIGEPVVGDGGAVAATGETTNSQEGFSAYLGAPIHVGGRRYGTLCFCDRDGRAEFSSWERAFVELLGEWLGNELTKEWAHEQIEAARSARSHLESARTSLDAGDEAAVRESLDVIESLLDVEPPSATAVSIELS